MSNTDEYIKKSTVLARCEDLWNKADETTQTGVDTINAIDTITDFIESAPAEDAFGLRWKYRRWRENPLRRWAEFHSLRSRSPALYIGR